MTTGDVYGSGPRFESMSLGGILDATFRMYGQDFFPLVAIALMCAVPPLLTRWATGFHTTPLSFVLDESVALFCAGLVSGALTFAVSARYQGHPWSVAEALAWTWKRLGTLVAATLAVVFVIVVGFALLIVPGILWTFTYSLVIPVVMLEGLSVKQAMRRSKQLVKYQRSKVVGVILTIWLLTAIGGGALGFGYGLLVHTLTHQAHSPLIHGAAVLGSMLQPLYCIALVLLYYDLRITHEGYDLEMLSQEMARA